MKTIIKFIGTAFVLLLLSTNIFAQGTTVYAEVEGWIVTPLSITQERIMEFGDVAISSTVAGDVTLTAEDVTLREAHLGATLPSTNLHGESSAKFVVNGYADATYAVTLPADPFTITRVGGSETMTVSNFVDNLVSHQSVLNSSGTDTFFVGAQMNVAAAQTPGQYKNLGNGFVVIVVYN
jgi:hypothetical protein